MMVKNNVVKIILITVLSVFSASLFFSQMSMTAKAEEENVAIVLVKNGIAENITGGQGGNSEGGIWFGKYNQSSDGNNGFKEEPIKWRVLENEDGLLFLLSDKNLDVMKYHESFIDMTWENCSMREWLNNNDNESDGFIKNAFGIKEQASITATEVQNENNSEFSTQGGNNTTDKIFLLSNNEAKNTNYGFSNSNTYSDTRKSTDTDYAISRGLQNNTNLHAYWWTRSPGKDQNLACQVNTDGTIDNTGARLDRNYGVRPALNVDLEAVLFTSAAEEDGANENSDDCFAPVGINSTNEWKLTLKDDGSVTDSEGKPIQALTGHKNFDIVSVSSCDGEEISIEYSDASTGTNEYVSAIIENSEGKVKYYGRIKNCTSESGNVDINIKNKMENGDELYLFNEQYNGNRNTNFASDLKKITFSPTDHDWKYTGMTWSGSETDGYNRAVANYECQNNHSHKNNKDAIIMGQIIKPTCTQDGKTEYSATILAQDSLDGKEHIEYKEANHTKAIGHNFSAWIKYDDQQHQRLCENDKSHIEREKHKWNSGTVTKKATTKQNGVKIVKCETCGATKTVTIPKLENMTKKVNSLKVSGKSVKIKYKILKKKAQTIKCSKVINVSHAKGKVTYKLSGVIKSKFKKYFKISKSNGNITVKKKLKKGIYKLSVKVMAAGNAQYRNIIKTVKVKVIIK